MATKNEGPNYIMAFLIILIIIFIFGKDYAYKETAIKLSKDPKNIIEGCLFLEKNIQKQMVHQCTMLILMVRFIRLCILEYMIFQLGKNY
ncbi:hypothetical protein [Acinetobacter sp.]|uniref:hypothetical protein n=1 Tax=Acinetobacter sp. TaxID=472 RepID=UPI002FC5A9FD